MPSRQIDTVLLTGAAGFIGLHVARALLARGLKVVGVDNLNAYYPVALKRARLALLAAEKNFVFHELDIADHARLAAIPELPEIDAIAHLAAQAGVRYSRENPFAYAASNLNGHLSVLELARHAPKKPRLVYASSSSVYGANTKTPFSEDDPVTAPVSLYAATKRADELMSEAYARLYGIPQIGLRFFTVYGTYGRPDMAYWAFTRAILAGEPIRVFNHGDMSRDFTHISDVAPAILATLLEPMKGDAAHRIYNVGNHRPEKLTRLIEIIEKETGREARKIFEPMQPGDVKATYADIDALARDYGYAPKTPLAAGLAEFVAWYRDWAKTGSAA